jgi:hypothetical protein
MTSMQRQPQFADCLNPAFADSVRRQIGCNGMRASAVFLKNEREELKRRVGRLLGLKMLNHLMNNFQVDLLEGPDSVINFALPKGFNEHLSLPRFLCRIRKELEKQRVITSHSIVQLPEHFPKNRPLGFLEYNVPKAAIVFEVFFGAGGAGRLLREPVGKIN